MATSERRYKVRQSPHYQEILEKLLQGDTYQGISDWLKEEHDEDISSAAICRYYQNRVRFDERVESAYDRLINAEASNELITNTLANETANVLNGLGEIGKTLPKIYQKMQEELEKPKPSVSLKDLASVALQATKIYVDFFKSQNKRIDVKVQKINDLFEPEFVAEVLDGKSESDEEDLE